MEIMGGLLASPVSMREKYDRVLELLSDKGGTHSISVHYYNSRRHTQGKRNSGIFGTLHSV